MEIVVVGRHTELSEKFRLHVEDKLAKIGPDKVAQEMVAAGTTEDRE